MRTYSESVGALARVARVRHHVTRSIRPQPSACSCSCSLGGSTNRIASHVALLQRSVVDVATYMSPSQPQFRTPRFLHLRNRRLSVILLGKSCPHLITILVAIRQRDAAKGSHTFRAERMCNLNDYDATDCSERPAK